MKALDAVIGAHNGGPSAAQRPPLASSLHNADPMRLLTVALAGLLALVYGELLFGSTGIQRVAELEGKLSEQKQANTAGRARNEQLGAEVRDLKEGLEMVEEKARAELGMVKADEILVQIAPRR